MIRIVVALALSCLDHDALAQTLQVQTLAHTAAHPAGEPAVTADQRLGFVLTWQERRREGRTALRYARIDTEGVTQASGDIASGTGWFVNWADFPALAIHDNGDWLAHWLQRSGTGYAYDIRIARSRDAGKSWSTPVTLHDDATVSEHGFVSHARAGGDAATMVWLDGRHTVAAGQGPAQVDGRHVHGAGPMSLRAARVSRAGIDASVELDDSVCDCCQTDAVRVGRDTLVVYRGRSAEEVRDVRLVRHDGERWRASEPLFEDHWTIPGCPVNGPAIAASGRRVMAAAYSEGGGVPAVRVRTSGEGGRRWNDPVTVNAGNTLGRLNVAAVSDGRFLLSRLDGVGETGALRVSLHDADGRTLHTATVANVPTDRLVGFPRMAALGDTALIAWTEPDAGQPRIRMALIKLDE